MQLQPVHPDHAETFAERVNAAWRAQHPFVPMPQITQNPTAEQLADPLWHDAERIWNEVATGLPSAPVPAPAAAPARTWTAGIGGMTCPNGHYVGMYDKFCPTCGAAVPDEIARQSTAATTVWSDNMTAFDIRNHL